MDNNWISQSVILSAANIKVHSGISASISLRSDLLTLSQQAHNACVNPEDAGGLSHTERAAISSRMCTLNHEIQLGNYYADLIPDSAEEKKIIDTNYCGHGHHRLEAVLRHVDLVTTSPKDASAADIRALEESGISTEDMVRLSELIAFVNYEIRVVKGIRLMDNVL